MNRYLNLTGCFFASVALFSPITHGQQIRVMQWNVEKALGNISSNGAAPAQAVARIANYNQPDILLFNEVEDNGSNATRTALINWVTNNVPYLGTQVGTSFYVAVSSVSDGFNRNCAISRYPISNTVTYDAGLGLRGLHSFKVQLTATNLQIFHAHLKCCSDGSSCTTRQTEAQFDSDVIKAFAATNSLPYIFAGDLNEEEEDPTPLCTLSTTYHPISTLKTNGGLAEFKPTMLNGQYRTWSTGPSSPSIRFDYILPATNRLTPTSGFVFSSMNWAANGLYTNASPQNLTNDSRTAADHYCVFADFSFATSSPPAMVLTPAGNFSSSGLVGGPFSPSSQVYTLSNSSASPVSWMVSRGSNWLTLSATNGALAASAATNITVAINASANSLAANTYSDTVSFTNVSGGSGTTARSVTLTVSNPVPQLTVTPATALTSTGPQGGSFSPNSQTYTLSNSGNGALNWTVSNSSNWVGLSASSGTLAPGSNTTVTVSINANANALAAGAYSDTVSFVNTNNGGGNTTRAVNLTVNSTNTGIFGFFDDFNTYASGNLVGQSNWVQVGAVATVPLQVSGGKVVIPFGQSADNQDVYKNFTQTNGTVFYGMTVAITNAPTNSSPSYFSALYTSNNAVGFANFRLTARAGDAGRSNFVFGIRITGQGTDPFTFGAPLLNTNVQHRVIVWAEGGGSNMSVYVNPTSSDMGSQAVYNDHPIGSGSTAPTSVGGFVISQFASGTAPNDGVLIGKVVIADNFATVFNALADPPVAAFTGAPTNGTAPLVVTFTDTSAGIITNRYWNFGDGSTTNATTTNVVHTYAAGTYDVTLVASGPGGNSTNFKANYISASALSEFQLWQIQYFGNTNNPSAAANSDPDGDGQNNSAEFTANTIPTNGASLFRISAVSREGTDLRITWTMGSGRTNALQMSSGNVTGSYNDIVSIVTAGSATNYLDVGGATNPVIRYYRVRIVP